MSESEYIRREAVDHPDEPEYHADLCILRRFVYNGSFGYKQSEDVVFQTLKQRYPKGYMKMADIPPKCCSKLRLLYSLVRIGY